MHEIKRAAEESTGGSEDGQRAHRGDKQAKPSPLNVFFGPASTLQRFNGSRHRRRYCADFFDRQVRTLSISVISCLPTP